MKSDHEMIRVKLENMRARAIKEREELMKRLHRLGQNEKVTTHLLKSLNEVTHGPSDSA